MQRAPRREILRNPGYEFHVVGVPAPGLRDLYHALLRVPWWATILTISGGYLLLNALFAGLYLLVGGVALAQPSSFFDAFCFSVQTMSTIGYGHMVPVTGAANTVMVCEAVTGLLVTAMATGLVFARFSQTRARVTFSSRVAIAPMDGVPTLMIRLGNDRRGRIVNAVFRATLTRTVQTAEGMTMYRSVDLPLVRDHAFALSRSWTLLHRIEPGSPLEGDSPASLAAGDVELTVAVAGVDDTSLQQVHALHTWPYTALVWGARLADTITEPDDHTMIMDLSRFHDLVATPAIAGFPYSAADHDLRANRAGDPDPAAP